MATVKLRYIHKVISKGKVYYNYRRNGQRIALPPDPHTPEFIDAWRQIHESFQRKDSADLISPGSIAALIADFKASAEYKNLGVRTKELYAYHLDDIKLSFGPFPVRAMTRSVVLNYRDRMAAGEVIDMHGNALPVSTPGKANNALKILSRIYSFAIDRGLAAANPVQRVKKLKMGSYRPWAKEEIEAFKAKAAPHIRLALAMALYSGQRQADIIKLRWNQIRDNGLELRQQKTGKELWIPIHNKLRTELDNALKARETASKTAVTIIATRGGKPYRRDWFIAEWKKTARDAGLPEECVFHGLRKTAAVHLAEAGCTNEQIKAITGHTTESMVAHYTRGANQKTLARAAIKKFEGRK